MMLLKLRVISILSSPYGIEIQPGIIYFIPIIAIVTSKHPKDLGIYNVAQNAYLTQSVIIKNGFKPCCQIYHCAISNYIHILQFHVASP